MAPHRGPRGPKIDAPQLRAARAWLGWSQHDLADRAGVSARTVAAIELGTVKPKRETIEQLASCLQGAGLSFSRTREFWPQMALRPASGGGEGAELQPDDEQG